MLEKVSKGRPCKISSRNEPKRIFATLVLRRVHGLSVHQPRHATRLVALSLLAFKHRISVEDRVSEAIKRVVELRVMRPPFQLRLELCDVLRHMAQITGKFRRANAAIQFAMLATGLAPDNRDFVMI